MQNEKRLCSKRYEKGRNIIPETHNLGGLVTKRNYFCEGSRVLRSTFKVGDKERID